MQIHLFESIHPKTEMLTSPEIIVKISIFHVLEKHHKRLAVSTYSVERDDVLVVQTCEELRLSVKVSAGVLQAHVLQGLDGDHGEVVPGGQALTQAQVHSPKGPLTQLTHEVDFLSLNVPDGG